MRWKISWLQELPDKYLAVDENVVFEKAMFQQTTNIDSVSPIKVKGYFQIEEGLILFNLSFSGVLTLVDAHDGELSTYPFAFNSSDLLDDSYQGAVNYKEDYFDLTELTWQNLIVEAPAYYGKDEITNRSGKDWRLLSEDDYYTLKNDTIDPRFAMLKDLVIKNEED